MRRALLAIIITTIAVSAFAQKECPQLEYRSQLLNSDPTFARKEAEIENFIANRTLIGFNNANRENGDNLSEIINIPVVVHVVISSSQQNVSDAQIKSQIDVLNKDFGG